MLQVVLLARPYTPLQCPHGPGKTLRLRWPRVWRLKLCSGSGRQIWGAEPLRPCYLFLLRVSGYIQPQLMVYEPPRRDFKGPLVSPDDSVSGRQNAEPCFEDIPDRYCCCDLHKPSRYALLLAALGDTRACCPWSSLCNGSISLSPLLGVWAVQSYLWQHVYCTGCYLF